jgi:hypothetical protein
MGRKKRNAGLFGPPKSKLLSEIVRIDTPENAKRSIKTLIQMFKTSNDPEWRLHIKRAIQQAAARASVIAENKRVSPKERKEAKEVSKMYWIAFWRLDHKTGTVRTKKTAIRLWHAKLARKARMKKPRRLKKLKTLPRRKRK